MTDLRETTESETAPSGVCPTLGEELIAELGRRGLRGAYFDYHGYCELRGIDSSADLQEFFDSRGFERVSAAGDLGTIAAGLAQIAARRGIRRVLLEAALHLAPLVWS
ncbi:MAG TPA: hypothetical protein VFW87_16535 [Pirellulales bacterium]|nr:hypothetical protein [Pirellulales bacterium]